MTAIAKGERKIYWQCKIISLNLRGPVCLPTVARVLSVIHTKPIAANDFVTHNSRLAIFQNFWHRTPPRPRHRSIDGKKQKTKQKAIILLVC
jgi:hypothetical protein